MRFWSVFLAALLLGTATGRAALSYSTFMSGTLADGAIPDGNPNGLSSTITVSGMHDSLSDLNVFVNVSGGYNGDLYAYLSYGNTSVVLLNRIGNTGSDPFGSSSSGFGTGPSNFKFDDAAANGNIHLYSGGGPITGIYQPDGRSAPPLTVTDGSPVGLSLAAFNGQNPNGNWTIFFADMAGGPAGNSSTLVSWGLEVTAPEPVNVALLVFAAALGGVKLLQLRRTLAARLGFNRGR